MYINLTFFVDPLQKYIFASYVIRVTPIVQISHIAMSTREYHICATACEQQSTYYVCVRNLYNRYMNYVHASHMKHYVCITYDTCSAYHIESHITYVSHITCTTHIT